MSTPNECNDSNFSQSACGFVVEFTDIITNHKMKTSNTNIGGWPRSAMHPFLNDENLDGLNGKELSIMKVLPDDLKSVIIDTKTVSGSGYQDTVEYFTSTDKLYLLSTAEIWSQGTSNKINYDTARDKTRQLDYYKEKGVTTNREDWNGAIKKDSTGSASWWWLRSVYSYSKNGFYAVTGSGDQGNVWVLSNSDVSPAFRIG